MSARARLQASRSKHVPGEEVEAVLEVWIEGVESKTCTIESLSAQAYGIERVDSSWVKSSYWSDEDYVKSSGWISRTLFKGQVTKVHEGTSLRNGDACIFRIRFTLPKNLPPSFRGRSVQYYYGMDVDVKVLLPQPETLSSSVHIPVVLREVEWLDEEVGNPSSGSKIAPIQFSTGSEVVLEVDDPVMNLGNQLGSHGSLENILSYAKRNGGFRPPGFAQAVQPKGRDVVPNNPMSAIGKNEIESPVSTMTQAVLLPGNRQPSYNLHVAGFLDFRVASRQAGSENEVQARCIGVTATLESKEEIMHEWIAGFTSSEGTTFYQIHCELSECTVDTVVTNLLLTVPSHATPSFSTSLVQFSWMLRLKFSMMINKKDETEEIIWTLPVRIGPQQISGRRISDQEHPKAEKSILQTTKTVKLDS